MPPYTQTPDFSTTSSSPIRDGFALAGVRRVRGGRVSAVALRVDLARFAGDVEPDRWAGKYGAATAFVEWLTPIAAARGWRKPPPARNWTGSAFVDGLERVAAFLGAAPRALIDAAATADLDALVRSAGGVIAACDTVKLSAADRDALGAVLRRHLEIVVAFAEARR